MKNIYNKATFILSHIIAWMLLYMGFKLILTTVDNGIAQFLGLAFGVLYLALSGVIFSNRK